MRLRSSKRRVGTAAELARAARPRGMRQRGGLHQPIRARITSDPVRPGAAPSQILGVAFLMAVPCDCVCDLRGGVAGFALWASVFACDVGCAARVRRVS